MKNFDADDFFEFLVLMEDKKLISHINSPSLEEALRIEKELRRSCVMRLSISLELQARAGINMIE